MYLHLKVNILCCSLKDWVVLLPTLLCVLDKVHCRGFANTGWDSITNCFHFKKHEGYGVKLVGSTTVSNFLEFCHGAMSAALRKYILHVTYLNANRNSFTAQQKYIIFKTLLLRYLLHTPLWTDWIHLQNALESGAYSVESQISRRVVHMVYFYSVLRRANIAPFPDFFTWGWLVVC